MKIIISGVEHFGKDLTRSLQKNDSKNQYIYLNIKTNIWKRLYFYFHLFTADILFVIYVDKYFMRSVDFALKLKKKVVLSWIGNDVMDNIPSIKEDKYNKDYINKTIHTTNSSWLQEELLEVDLKAKFLTLFTYKNKERKIVVPDSFSVLLYVVSKEEKFYGMDTFIKLAKDLPHIQFKVAGIEHYEEDIPSNIRLLGWVNMDNEYENSTVYIRYPEHDGEAHSVLEALSYGKTVFYNRDYPYVNYVQNYEELKSGLGKVYEEFKKNKLRVNSDGINYIKSNYEEKKVVQEYQKLFQETIEKL